MAWRPLGFRGNGHQPGPHHRQKLLSSPLRLLFHFLSELLVGIPCVSSGRLRGYFIDPADSLGCACSGRCSPSALLAQVSSLARR